MYRVKLVGQKRVFSKACPAKSKNQFPFHRNREKLYSLESKYTVTLFCMSPKRFLCSLETNGLSISPSECVPLSAAER